MFVNHVSPAYTNTRVVVPLFFGFFESTENRLKVFSVCTYWTVLPVLVRASALAERHTFVSAEDEAVVAHTPFHARIVARAFMAHRMLASGLATSRSTWVVVTARGAFQG